VEEGLMTVVTVVCDVCGRKKGETNHWFKAKAGSVGFRVWPAGGAPSELSNLETRRDLCGAACVNKALNNWMEKQRAATGKVNG
jgi:hypothetical protein